MKKINKCIYRGWKYAKLGDYHKNLDPNWSYTPTYLKKMEYVRSILDTQFKVKILDIGCGEGVLVEEYSQKGFKIKGIDLNFKSRYVRRGNILKLPYPKKSFNLVLLLDVFEHLSFTDQNKALDEIRRVLISKRTFIISVPNLAHLNSRVQFFLRGKLDRTDVETNHIGERPFKENLKILKNSGFNIIKIKGITLTFPFIYRKLICRHPAKFKWLHNLLEIFTLPSLSMLNIFICQKRK